jgi:hypothetical protein
MTEERIYVIVPQSVQIVRVAVSAAYTDEGSGVEEVESFPMVHGRLIAQGFHVGRLLERMFSNAGMAYREITAITLAVRNSKELTKVSSEAKALLNANDPHGENFRWFYGEFHDHNPGFYGTDNRVHTITAFGPTTREIVEDAIGHLELY